MFDPQKHYKQITTRSNHVFFGWQLNNLMELAEKRKMVEAQVVLLLAIMETDEEVTYPTDKYGMKLQGDI